MANTATRTFTVKKGEARNSGAKFVARGKERPELNTLVMPKIQNQNPTRYFQLQNRRYLGNKYKLLDFIEEIVEKNCTKVDSLCDIFAGTGVVGHHFNNTKTKIIANDILASNYSCLKSFLGLSNDNESVLVEKINYLNSLVAKGNNYFSKNFGGTYFSEENSQKIGLIRETIDHIAENEDEKLALICSLMYAVDKVANTVGHYDAYRKDLDMLQPIRLSVPKIDYKKNNSNEIYKEDANLLVRKITCDVLYIDPPYNSRQYSDAYHLLENLAEWKKPEVHGTAKKMDRSHIKSAYCLKDATDAFEDLIKNAQCRYILLSYNNTGEKKDGRSNARIQDSDIVRILKNKGKLKIFERDYRAFTAGKSNGDGHTERVFFCKVTQ